MNINKDSSMLLDIQYIKPNRKEKQPDYLYIIHKDIDTGEKKLEIMPEPKMTIYFEKPEYRNHNYPKNYARMEELDPVTVKYKDIIYAIADHIGAEGKNRLNECFQTGNYKAIEEFYAYPYVYGADYDIRVWYRHMWKKTLNNDKPKKLTKGFMDIEVDSLESTGMPNPINNPIDLITLIDSDKNEAYTFSLVGVDYKPKDITGMSKEQLEHEEWKKALYAKRMEAQEYYSNHPEEIDKAAHEEFDESYPDFKYHFYFYTDEKKMLIHFWQLVNSLKLDMIAVWNIAFDIPYIIERLQALGLNPAEVMCHPDFPVKECWFKKDRLHFDIKNKTDFFHISSYTIFLDQMVSYAAIRKGGSELRSHKLNYIAQKEIHDEKLDYSEDGNIKTVSYLNYLKYILYNIKDTLLQHGIEHRTSDMDTCYAYAYQNMTPYESIFKQTVTLRDVQYESFMQQNLVPGENINQIYAYRNKGSSKEFDEDGNPIEDSGDGDDSKFEGALVGDPTLIDYFGEELFGRKTCNIFAFSIDLDMSAFYPSTIMAFNIDPSCLIFKVIVPAEQFEPRGGELKYHGITDVQLNKHNSDSFTGDIGKEICDNLQTKNYLSFGYKWFNLPSVNEVYERMLVK